MRTDPLLDFPDGFQFEGTNLPGRHFNDGVSQSGRERNHLFLNVGAERFENASGVSGLDHPADARAFAILDFDRDGFSDLAVVNANEPLFQLFRNELGAAGGGFIAVSFEGANRGATPKPGTSPRDGTGARVEAVLGETRLVRGYRTGEGLAAQNHARLLLGIGDAPEADALEVVWPSGKRQRIAGVPAGSHVHFREDAEPVRQAYRPTPAPGEGGGASGPRLLADRVDPPDRLRIITTLATWCEACVSELPYLADLKERFPDAAYWGVSVEPEDTVQMIDEWRERHRPPYELLEVPPGTRDAVREHVRRVMGREALPATIVTDASGRVLVTRWGVPTVSELRALSRLP